MKHVALTRFAGVVIVLMIVAGGAGAQAPAPSARQDRLAPQAPLGSGFTYQGQLKNAGSPVNGACDFQFSLWDAAGSGAPPAGGAQLGITQTLPVTVTNGLFTVVLNGVNEFGNNAFTGEARWLQIAVRCPSGGGAYATLSPRQPITPAPYALALPGLRTQPNATSPNVIGGYSGNRVEVGVVGATIGGGGSAASGDINQVSANYGTIGGGVGNAITMSAFGAIIGGGRYNTVSGDDATIGGGRYNVITSTASAATIGGGRFNRASGADATIGGGRFNTASGFQATIGGGESNTASDLYATIAGGYFNTANGLQATVGGGNGNTAGGGATISGGTSNFALGNASTIGGGVGNTVTATGFFATISGGTVNIASGTGASIGGGVGHVASGNGSFIGGGESNLAGAEMAVLGGGYGNVITTSAHYGTISGGVYNIASGPGSVVGGGGYDGILGTGNRAYGNASAIGGGISNTITTTAHYAVISGGSGNTTSGQYAIVPGGKNNLAAGNYSFAAGCGAQAMGNGTFLWVDSNCDLIPITTANQFQVRASGGVVFRSNLPFEPESGVILNTGASAWSTLSDRASKDNLTPVDGRDILKRLASVPIQTWNWKSQTASIRHIGPVAQDFYAAFSVGEDEQHISTVDADGVALAAIQGLSQENQELKSQVAHLEVRLAALEHNTPANNPVNSNSLALIVIGALLGIIVVQKPWRRGER